MFNYSHFLNEKPENEKKSHKFHEISFAIFVYMNRFTQLNE